MNPSVKSSSNQQPLISSSDIQQPLIPQITLDPFSTAAIFALYNVLPDQDRLGNAKHLVIHQPDVYLCTLPLIGEINSQSLSRKYYHNSRDDASNFVIAIIESISAYLKYESFKKMLPHLEKGLIRYVNSYGTVTDNATTTFQLAIDRIQEAIQWKGPEEFQTKHKEKLPKELTQNHKKYYEHWSESDIDYVTMGIFLAVQKHKDKKNFEAEVTSVKQYLDVKQNHIITHLESKLKTLQNIQ
jgi:hypothetical protein